MKGLPTASGTLFSRRRFLQTAGASAVLTRSGWARGLAPSDKITIGVIGWGMMGPANTKAFLTMDDCQVVAACELDGKKMQEALATINGHYGNQDCKPYHDYREMIARTDIDPAGPIVMLFSDAFGSPVPSRYQRVCGPFPAQAVYAPLSVARRACRPAGRARRKRCPGGFPRCRSTTGRRLGLEHVTDATPRDPAPRVAVEHYPGARRVPRVDCDPGDVPVGQARDVELVPGAAVVGGDAAVERRAGLPFVTHAS